MIFSIIFTLWSGFIWRLRGGAFATLSNINIGTQGTRFACGFLIALPLSVYYHNYWLLFLSITLTVGLMIGGWAPFQNMGLRNTTATSSYLYYLLDALKLTANSTLWCIVGMAEIGFVVTLPSILLLLFAVGIKALWLLLMIVFFPVSYYVTNRVITFPTLGWFAQGSDWAEVLVGLGLGLSLNLALS